MCTASKILVHRKHSSSTLEAMSPKELRGYVPTTQTKLINVRRFIVP